MHLVTGWELKWQDKVGDQKIPETNADKVVTLQNFVFIVYTAESDSDFDSLPTRVDVKGA